MSEIRFKRHSWIFRKKQIISILTEFPSEELGMNFIVIVRRSLVDVIMEIVSYEFYKLEACKLSYWPF